MGVRQYFVERTDFAKPIETGDGEECLRLISTYQPDVAVLDLVMPGKTGFEVLEALDGRFPETQIIVMSMHADASYAERAEALGASAFIAKEDALSEIENALLHRPRQFYQSKSVGRTTLNPLIEQSDEKFENLTASERRVLKLLAQGLTSKEISEHLDISIRTVQAHRRNMTEKLDLRGPNRLMEYAVRNSKSG